MKELADIGLLRAFVAVAEARSFADGAKRVGLTRSAAGKAIVRLEELLDARLLHRTTRRVGLTADGQVFLQRASQILTDLEEAQAVVMRGGSNPRGALRITAPEAFGRQAVLPILKDYLDRWPDLSVEVNLSDRVTDIVYEGYDLAIRFGSAPEASDLITRVITRSVGQLCASPTYLTRYRAPSTIEELTEHHQLLSGTRDSPRAWVLQKNRETPIAVPARPLLLCDNAGALRDAARAGLGVACLPQFLLVDDLSEGKLEAILPGYTTPEIPIAVVYPTRRHLMPKVRMFITLLDERLGNGSIDYQDRSNNQEAIHK